jgi:hypothetical protein
VAFSVVAPGRGLFVVVDLLANDVNKTLDFDALRTDVGKVRLVSMHVKFTASATAGTRDLKAIFTVLGGTVHAAEADAVENAITQWSPLLPQGGFLMPAQCEVQVLDNSNTDPTVDDMIVAFVFEQVSWE